MRGFILGIIVTILCIVGAFYFLLQSGRSSLATTSQPLPGEQALANYALHASMGDAKDVQDPLPVNDNNMVAGVKEFKEHCVYCHGAPGKPSPVAKMMFPHPPQLFEKDDMVTDDPEGVTYWKVTNGIRLSGMPGFGEHLSDSERWQITMVLKNADKLPAAAQQEFTHQDVPEPMMHEEGQEHEHGH